MPKGITSKRKEKRRSILKAVKGKVLFNEPLNKHTTFKIGGRAEIWLEPLDKTDLLEALNYCKRHRIKPFIIGAGSNLLIKESGFKGMVINLNSAEFKQIKLKGNILQAGAGIAIANLINYTVNNSLSGFEFLAGMPGTVGGAIAMNVGTHSPEDFSEQHNICDLIESIEYLDKNYRFHRTKAKSIKFSYRKSNLHNCIILSASFNLQPSNKKDIKLHIHKYLDYRRKTQDYTYPSAGCIFKNPRGVSAGFLIDACGLKGKRIGKAMFSNKHANFIINLGNASSKSVLKLIDLASCKVKEIFGVDLDPEIKIIGD